MDAETLRTVDTSARRIMTKKSTARQHETGLDLLASQTTHKAEAVGYYNGPLLYVHFIKERYKRDTYAEQDMHVTAEPF